MEDYKVDNLDAIESFFNETYLDDDEDYVVDEMICVRCFHRHIGVYPSKLWLSDIRCDKCGAVGTTIVTGQILPEEYYE